MEKGKKKTLAISSSLKKNPELDFMHFKGEGHRLLAEYLFIEIKKIVE